MKQILFVPAWLKGFLERRQLGLDAICDFDRLQSILSEEDVKSYRAAQDVARLPSIYNPFMPLFDEFKIQRDIEPCDDNAAPAYSSCVPHSNMRMLLSNYPELFAGLEEQHQPELFYRAMITGDYNGNAADQLHGLVTFDIEFVQDIMVVIASPSENDIRLPSARAAIIEKCIEKMHLCMSFERIAATGIFGSYLSNRFWDMRT